MDGQEIKYMKQIAKLNIYKLLLAGLIILAAGSLFMSILSAEEASLAPRRVRIMGSKGRWHMTVDGAPYYIKGIGCGDYLHEEIIDKELVYAKGLGANTLRRWGESDHDRLILDKSYDLGLMVMMGYWLPTELNYVDDPIVKEAVIDNIESFIRQYKDHPALLIWGIGNETIVLGELEMKKKEIEISKEEREARRVKFAKFLEDVCQMIHEVDPNHPVAYAGAGFTALEYIKKYTPSLDIYGVNFYGGAPIAYDAYCGSRIEIPYIFTEFGPLGPWEVRKDVNGLPVEPSETEKAESFKNVWLDCIKQHEGYNLGGFAFHLGEKITGIEGSSPTWWGLMFEDYKKRSYWMVRYMYTGIKPENYPPIIKYYAFNKYTDLRPQDILKIKVKVVDNEEDALRASLRVLDAESLKFIDTIRIDNISSGIAQIPLDYRGGIYRVYLFVEDSKGNITCANKSISIKEE